MGYPRKVMIEITPLNNYINKPSCPVINLRYVENKPGIFLVHPIGGTVACYYSLIEALPPNYSLYAIQAAGILDGLAPLRTIEELAACYESLIQTIQPTGPYYLAGWSFGGIIAYDLACRLTKRNEKIQFLGLIDSLFSWGREDSLANEKFLISLFINDLFNQNIAQEELYLAIEQDPNSHTILENTYEFCLQKGVFDNLINYQIFCCLYEVFKSHNEAHIKFKPSVLDNTIYHFIAEEKSANTEQSVNAWRLLTNNCQRVKMVLGNHYTMFSKANVSYLASEFDKAVAYSMKESF